MTDATRAPSTRRTVLASVGGLAFTTIAPPTNANTPFNPEPSWRGQLYLRYAALLRYWVSRTAESDAWEIFIETRLRICHAELARLQSDILARPVASTADLIDRLILLAHEADPSWCDSAGDLMPILKGALAAAGINAGDCCVGLPDRANELAARAV